MLSNDLLIHIFQYAGFPDRESVTKIRSLSHYFFQLLDVAKNPMNAAPIFVKGGGRFERESFFALPPKYLKNNQFSEELNRHLRKMSIRDIVRQLSELSPDRNDQVTFLEIAAESCGEDFDEEDRHKLRYRLGPFENVEALHMTMDYVSLSNEFPMALLVNCSNARRVKYRVSPDDDQGVTGRYFQQILPPLPHLEDLELDCDAFSNEGLSGITSKTSRLKALLVGSGHNLTVTGMKQALSPVASSLEMLDLSYGFWTFADAAEILSPLSNLKTVKLNCDEWAAEPEPQPFPLLLSVKRVELATPCLEPLLAMSKWFPNTKHLILSAGASVVQETFLRKSLSGTRTNLEEILSLYPKLATFSDSYSLWLSELSGDSLPSSSQLTTLTLGCENLDPKIADSFPILSSVRYLRLKNADRVSLDQILTRFPKVETLVLPISLLTNLPKNLLHLSELRTLTFYDPYPPRERELVQQQALRVGDA